VDGVRSHGNVTGIVQDFLKIKVFSTCGGSQEILRDLAVGVMEL